MVRKGIFVASFVVFLLGGCFAQKKLPPPPTLYGVKGKVLLNNQPVPVGTVVFTPEKAGHGVRAEGLLKQDGTFAVAAYGGYDGTTPGAYIVSVEAYEPIKHGNFKGKAPSIPKK